MCVVWFSHHSHIILFVWQSVGIYTYLFTFERVWWEDILCVNSR